MDLFEKLTALQVDLKAPKGQFNKFGKYSYRNCEDILEAVKPLLKAHGLSLVVSDEVVLIGDRFYVKAVATVTDIVSQGSQSAKGYARECDSKKGMDDAQLTGSCSSYARKYALNGLFLIDDTKDADSMENKPTVQANKPAPAKAKAKPHFTKENLANQLSAITADIATGVSADAVIQGLEYNYIVGDGAKAAIRGIK